MYMMYVLFICMYVSIYIYMCVYVYIYMTISLLPAGLTNIADRFVGGRLSFFVPAVGKITPFFSSI